MSFWFSSRGVKKTCASRRTASTTVPSGYCSSTAPSVPPKTIIAAVGCTICPRLPPSSNSPATIPATASRTPPKLALSITHLVHHQAPESLVVSLPISYLLRALPADGLDIDSPRVLVCHRDSGRHDLRRCPRIGAQAGKGHQPVQVGLHSRCLAARRHRGQQQGTVRQHLLYNLSTALAHD